MDTGEEVEAWQGRGRTQAGGNQGSPLTEFSLSYIATIIDHVIEHKFLFCKSGIGAWTYVTLLKTGREIVIKASASYDSLTNPCQKITASGVHQTIWVKSGGRHCHTRGRKGSCSTVEGRPSQA